jgi:hypothetical protein
VFDDTARSISFSGPPLNTGFPSGQVVAVKSDLFHFFKITKGGKGFITMPRSCPASRFWTNTLFCRYYGGKTNTVSSRSPCTTS